MVITCSAVRGSPTATAVVPGSVSSTSTSCPASYPHSPRTRSTSSACNSGNPATPSTLPSGVPGVDRCPPAGNWSRSWLADRSSASSACSTRTAICRRWYPSDFAVPPRSAMLFALAPLDNTRPDARSTMKSSVSAAAMANASFPRARDNAPFARSSSSANRPSAAASRRRRAARSATATMPSWRIGPSSSVIGTPPKQSPILSAASARRLPTPRQDFAATAKLAGFHARIISMSDTTPLRWPSRIPRLRRR